MAPLAVLGATGYTGRLVCREARSLGLELRLVGRRRGALEGLAQPGEEVRVADARDPAALRAAFEGAFAVASLAGPFLEVGDAPIEAAIAAGAHYVDVTGEQPFARRVYERFGARAQEAGVVLLTAFGFDYVPGDLAARLAAAPLPRVDEIAVGYSVTAASASRGTKRTLALLAGLPHAALADGHLVESSFGETSRRFRFPFGERHAVEWGGTEPLTVPRHTPSVRTVRSYLRAPRVAGAAGRFGRAAAPLLRLAARVGPAGPPEERRRAARFAVVAEARGPDGARRATLVGGDVYGFTALAVAQAARALRDGEVRAAGALAPAEAFDAHRLVERLAPLLQLLSIDEL
ncbi:MAG TPA: NAD(P)H-binding protein [Gaiellaceae bacterium]|nr:NAD(P)H-binding protein [Gaiellaceae bacterium]